jgi:hypothetical protein
MNNDIKKKKPKIEKTKLWKYEKKLPLCKMCRRNHLKGGKCI